MPIPEVQQLQLDEGPTEWAARWIHAETGADPSARAGRPAVVGFRLRVESAEAAEVVVHVSADERYELWVDGELVGRGPSRGDVAHWAYESYRLQLPAGGHWLAARVWSLGDDAPLAQLSAGDGPTFFLAAEASGLDLDTGSADWQAAVLPGHGLRPKGAGYGCGARHVSDGRAYPWGWQTGDWPDATPAEACRSNRVLVPARLPAPVQRWFGGGRVRHVAEHPVGEPTRQRVVDPADHLEDEARDWQRLLDGTALVLPPRMCRRVLIDLDQYVCAYPVLDLDGGRDAEVRLLWQESLYERNPQAGKGHRDVVEGKLFGRPGLDEDGIGDLFIAGGGHEQHSTLWWQSGRYVEVLVTTTTEPLTITGLRFRETHYPYEDRSRFTASDPRLARVGALAFRTLQACSHETTMDCPYYEQLQYAGDTRLQCLIAYATTGDDALARQALRAFAHSQQDDGLVLSRTPSRQSSPIPPFTLWWVAMVHDFALWRGDLAFVAELMPGVRAALDAHRRTVDDRGIFHAVHGWNFTDWVPGWEAGCPPGIVQDGEVHADWPGPSHGVSAVLHLQPALVARQAAQLETWLGGTSDQYTQLADRLLDAADEAFYDADRGLYADDLAHTAFSEHAQSLALLAGAKYGETAVRTMLQDPPPGLARTTVYFDHYLFEALHRIGRTDVLLDRLGLWYGLLDQGLRTVIEHPEPTRSDCHAWGAHPLYHYVATLLGVRPTAPGMTAVTVAPQLGGLEWAQASVPTPYGPLEVRAVAGGPAEVTAPPEITVTS
ncbi:alpha-L-rhamnosidase C-terminal domain-containing protein [Kribbella sp.]|uniref:alpha-L-rhamnosidase-related protein n=1 Tax=Kribbella sp. TaxID=1871183 RepID=UPI002D41C3D9|nr:alpha-L-rhamnosidase C-terminal domain-containing protein [Kribbella sp.]HZX01919.1 alpha-L-rhamnosidase C-terminal domain-containing protein [Kribbella sp.]